MTDPNQNPDQPQPFANSYPMPQDQLAFELSLLDGFAAKFPDSTVIMQEALSDIKRFSGIEIPKYEYKGTLSGDASEENNTADEQGSLRMGTGATGTTKLVLKAPIERTSEEEAQMSAEEKTEAFKTDDGHILVGDIPPATEAMLNGIYGLIGAQTIRDDRTAGETEGIVLRLGTYQGVPIYIAEYFKTKSYYGGGKPDLSVGLIGRDYGESVANELTHSQFKEFAEAVGSTTRAGELIRDNDITIKNYKEVAALMRQTRDVIDGKD